MATTPIESKMKVFLKNGNDIEGDWLLKHIPCTLEEAFTSMLDQTYTVLNIQTLRIDNRVIAIPPEEILYIETSMRDA